MTHIEIPSFLIGVVYGACAYVVAEWAINRRRHRHERRGRVGRNGRYSEEI